MLLVIQCVIACKIPTCLLTGPRMPDFLLKQTKGPLWFRNLYKSVWVDSWLASFRPHVQGDPRTTQSSSIVSTCRSGDQLRCLCLGRELNILLRMEQRGNVLSVNAYRSLLKACAQRKALADVKQVHSHLARCGLESSRLLGEYLVATLTKCGGIEDALHLFRRLPHRTVFSWAALISWYAMSRQGDQALTMYRQMQEEGVQPNAYTFVSILRACGSLSDLAQGKRIHADILRYHFGSDPFVGTCLVDMYGKCGSIEDAQMVFDLLDQRDVVSWTAILTIHTQQGQPENTLELYEQMLEEGVSPDVRTFVSVLQACGMLAENEPSRHVSDPSPKLEFLKTGRAVHAAAHRQGYDADVYLGNTLVSMYGKCGSTGDAENVFDKLLHRDVVSWNAMIAAYGQQGRPEKAWQLYEQMREDGVSPDVRTFVSTLQACGMLADEDNDFAGSEGGSVRFNSLYKCKIVHADAQKRGCESDVFLGNTIVSMYGKCRSSLDAHESFSWLSSRNVVSWTAILLAYSLAAQAEKALEVYKQMQEEAVSPNDRTFVSMLQVCGLLAEREEGVVICGQFIKLKSLEIGKALHACVYRNAYMSDNFVCSSLITMYGRCGSILDARVVFDGWAKQSVVAWTAMLTAYVERGHGQAAVQLFGQMQQEGVSTDSIALVCILQACSKLGSLDMCTQVHHTLVLKRTNLSPVLANTLIHAYGKCASMVDAQNVFDALVHPDVVSWNALLAGYSRQGSYLATFQCYEEMQLSGIRPNGITFLSLLCACSHAGFVDQGVEYFKSMTDDHSISPEIEHYASLADLLGRAGYLKNVEDMLTTMPLQPSMSMWLCLLGACRKHGNVVLGKKAFDCAVRVEPKHAAAYVLMWNMYADAGLWKHANEINELRQKAGSWQNFGQSWSEHGRGVCSFGVGDSRYAQVHAMVGKLNMELSQEQNNSSSHWHPVCYLAGSESLGLGVEEVRSIQW